MDVDFERVAAAWDRWFPTREVASRSVSERLVSAARIGLGASVLDVGTGLGEPALTAARAAGAGGRVVAVDVSPAMIRLASRRAQREKITNVEFIVGDGVSSAPAFAYDAVVSRWGLMFVAEVDAVLTAILALLRPGGGFAAATWSTPQAVPFLSLPMFALNAAYGVPFDERSGPFALADPADLERRLRAAGFVSVSVEPHDVCYAFGSPSEYFDHVTDTAPPVSARLAALDDDARARFRGETETLVRQRFGLPDGTVRIANRALIASGRRPG